MLQINNCTSIYFKEIHFISLSRVLDIDPFQVVRLWKLISPSTSGYTPFPRETMEISEILSKHSDCKGKCMLYLISSPECGTQILPSDF